MEKIFLKLELVVILIYFSILVKVFCFFIIFCFKIFKFFCSKIILVVFFVVFIVVFIEIFIFVLFSVGMLLILLLRNFMEWLLFCIVEIRCILCFGVSFVKIWVCFIVFLSL